MNSLPNHIHHHILKYTFPVNELNNIKIHDTINNILTKSGYCSKCGENNKSFNCVYCNTVLYYYCKKCMRCTGDNLLCCYESYKVNGLYNKKY